MTDVQDSSAAAEPSMEEILASIRRIIADEKEGTAEAEAESAPLDLPQDDVLELTQAVQDDGSVMNVKDMPLEPMPPEPPPAPSVAPPPPPAPEEDLLLSQGASNAAGSSLAALAGAVENERRASFPGFTHFGDGDKTLEAMVMDLLRPMLKEWLDQNLPAIVEHIVKKEVERIARRVSE
ncbi:MAG: DUF2497 domain-containing protein [Alphaproteobacteria bacterium]|nr:DUF2497 domain-containing protein [Alphaproteobacteria bacterium]